MYHTDSYSEHSSIILPCWPNGGMFIYELSSSGFQSSCSHWTFRLWAYFGQVVPWHLGNYRVWIHSETSTWQEHTFKRTVQVSPQNTAETMLAKWLSVRLRAKWFWVRVQLQSLNVQTLCLLQARSSLTFRQPECRFTLKRVRDMTRTYNQDIVWLKVRILNFD